MTVSTSSIDGLESFRRKRGAEDEGDEEGEREEGDRATGVMMGWGGGGGGLRKRALVVEEDPDAMET